MSYIFNKEELAIIIDMMEKLSTKCEPKSCADLVMNSINNKPKKYGGVKIDWKIMNKFTGKVFGKYEKELKRKEKND